MVRLARRWLLHVLSALAVLVALPQPAPAASNMALDFFHLLNATRADYGLPPLRAHGEIVVRADQWSRHMASNGQMRHSPQEFTNDATWAAENVGYTTSRDARELHSGFMASDSHRRHILDRRATFVGLGVAEGNGRIWVTHQFSNATH